MVDSGSELKLPVSHVNMRKISDTLQWTVLLSYEAQWRGTLNPFQWVYQDIITL
jgi:hypothetical protein